jgi:hypothetical protein
MIGLLALALKQGLGVRQIRRAAISFYTPSLTKPALRRILALLRKLG